MTDTAISAPAAWLSAIRPATLTAALTPVAVGSAMAAADGSWDLGVVVAALVGAILIQIGTNLFNDYEDFKRGADNEIRLGPARATQKGWLTPAQVLRGAVISFIGAVLAGITLVVIGGWPIVAVGLVSILCGVLYTGGPYPLAYVGLGDLFVMLFFGNVAVTATYFLHTATITPEVLWASVAVGAIATAILVVNNLRDRHTDALAHKRTLAVRLGARFSRIQYTALLAAAYVIPAGLALSTARPGWALCLLSAPLALGETRAVWTRDGAALNPHLGGTARLGLVHGALMAVGVLL